MAFNVSFDIQSSDNPVDWTALTSLNLESISWSSRSVPVGTSDEMDIMSFSFKLPMWISPPAKVQQQNVIHQIVNNIHDSRSPEYDDRIDGQATAPDGINLTQCIETVGNHHILVNGNEVTLMGGTSEKPASWKELFEQYGTYSPFHTQLRLRADLNQEIIFDIAGTVQLHDKLPNVLFWQVDIDTLPVNTMKPVFGVIDPLSQFPNRELPSPTIGQRYMILEKISPNTTWGNINANVGDIIEYTILGWDVVFEAYKATKVEYMVNQRSNKQLKLVDGQWIMAIDGEYNPGFWRIYV